METHPISQNSNRAPLKQKESPRNKFQKALEKASRTERDEKKKKKRKEESPLLDGPVTNCLSSAVSVEGSNARDAAQISKGALQIVHQLKPKLISISENGISKTIVQLKSELFANLEVEIDHYDTNPSQFILSFRGDERAQQIVAANQSQLATALKGALPNFQFTLSPPAFRPLSSRKKKSSKNTLVKTPKVRYCADNSGV